MATAPGKSHAGRVVALVFGLAAAAIAVAWIVFADDIYLTRLTAFVVNCF